MKQTAKRFFALLLAFSMCLSLAAPAWAAEVNPADAAAAESSAVEEEAPIAEAPLEADTSMEETPAEEISDVESQTQVAVETPAEEAAAKQETSAEEPEETPSGQTANNASDNTEEETLDAQSRTYSGYCGSNVKWSLSGTTLTISGSGKMWNWSCYDDKCPPWDEDNLGYYTDITKIVIKSGVTSIGDEAFYCLQEVKSVSIPGSVKSIGRWAFCACSSLTSVTIPNGVTSIGTEAFAGAEEALGEMQLKSVTIPQSVTKIGKDAFYECSNLKKVTVLSKKVSLSKTGIGYAPDWDSDNVKPTRISGFTIVGYSGSTTEQYAQKNGFTFQDYKTGKKIAYPSKVTLSGVSNVKGKKLKVSWKKNTSGSGYQIQYSTDKNFKKSVTKKTVSKNSTTSATYSKLKKGKKYYVRIRSYKKISGKTYYSSWSSVKSVTIKK